MSKTLRTLAAAAMLAIGLTQVANAALVQRTINFDDAVTGDDLTTAAGNPYDTLASAGHTTFSVFYLADNAAGRAEATSRGAGNNALSVPCRVAACNAETFTLVIAIADLFHGDGTALHRLSFDYINRGQEQQVNIFRDDQDPFGNVNIGTGRLAPNGSFENFSLEFTSGHAKYITFTGLSTAFGIDNLSFSTDDAPVTPPNDTPEPASVALVALALAGAATATRRRKR